MATGNFYQSGNHGLNVIDTRDDEFALEDTISNIVCELSSKGYSVDSANHLIDTPRSFDTGLGYLVVTPKGKYVAFLEVCAGYYEGANINIYTGQELEDIVDYGYNVSKNKKDIDRVVKCVKLYTEEYVTTARFSNGETFYEKVTEVK